MCKESGQYVLRGVTSWGDGCGLEHFPGVYARVTSATDWMHNVMEGAVSSDQDDDTTDFDGLMWAVVDGPCTIDDLGCIQSPNFPANYTAREASWFESGLLYFLQDTVKEAFRGKGPNRRCWAKAGRVQMESERLILTQG